MLNRRDFLKAAGLLAFWPSGCLRQTSYYLTYHKFATRDQILACYPQFPEFLRLKRRYDPEERFQSDWYRHYRRMFADVL